jgi:hypothetical protein
MVLLKKYKLVNIFYFISIFYVLGVFINMLLKHYLIVTHPYQLEYREIANLLDTNAILNGENPYSLKNQPDLGTCYGIGYPLVCAIFSKFFGITLFSHRLVSILSIILTSVLFFMLLRKEKIDKWLSFAGTVILYLNISFNNQAICRPDALGMLFFSISVFTPIYYNYSNKSLIIGLIFSISSFYIKQYFIIGFAIIILFIFLFKSIKKSFIFGFIYGALFLFSAYIVKFYFETYFYSTSLAMLNLAVNKIEWSKYQLEEFFLVTHFGLSILLLICIFIFIISNFSFLKNELSNFNLLMNVEKQINIKDLSKGFLSFNFNIFIFLFLSIGLLLLVKLGGNDGAFLTYHFQLLSFCFIIMLLKFSVIYPNSKLLFIPFILISIYSSNLRDKTWPLNKKDINDWQKVSKIIKNSKDVLNSPVICYELFLNNKHIYDTGLNEHWINYRCNKNTIPGKMVIKTQINIKSIQYKIRHQKFDVLILNKENNWTVPFWQKKDENIKKFYVKKDSLNLKMFQTNEYWPIEIWIPKTKYNKV